MSGYISRAGNTKKYHLRRLPLVAALQHSPAHRHTHVCVFVFLGNTLVHPGPRSSSPAGPAVLSEAAMMQTAGDASSATAGLRWATRRWTLTPLTSAVCTDAPSVCIGCANTIFRLVYITQHVHLFVCFFSLPSLFVQSCASSEETERRRPGQATSSRGRPRSTSVSSAFA